MREEHPHSSTTPPRGSRREAPPLPRLPEQPKDFTLSVGGKETTKAAPQEERNTHRCCHRRRRSAKLSLSLTPLSRRGNRPSLSRRGPIATTENSRSRSGLGRHQRRALCQDHPPQHTSPPTWPKRIANTSHYVARRRANRVAHHPGPPPRHPWPPPRHHRNTGSPPKEHLCADITGIEVDRLSARGETIRPWGLIPAWI